MAAKKDNELLAIGSIIELLTPLKAAVRRRVIDYVMTRFEMHGLFAAVSRIEPESDEIEEVGLSRGSKPTSFVEDIRSLTAEKQPRSAVEMVAVIAYYVSELAPHGERSQTVNNELVRRYFKEAGFPMPNVPSMALPNAAAAGYMKNVARGEWRLTPVGYNLVVHRLPRDGSEQPASKRGPKKTKKKKAKRR